MHTQTGEILYRINALWFTATRFGTLCGHCAAYYEDMLANEAPQSLASLSAPPVRVLMVACSKSVASADEGPAVLVLGEPHESGALHDQFKRFLLADSDQRWDGRPGALDSIL